MEYIAQFVGKLRWEGAPVEVGPKRRAVIMETPNFGFFGDAVGGIEFDVDEEPGSVEDA